MRDVVVEIVLDPAACQELALGDLRCDLPYYGRYESKTNTWTISGSPKFSSDIYTNSNSVPGGLGNISIWRRSHWLVSSLFPPVGRGRLDPGLVPQKHPKETHHRVPTLIYEVGHSPADEAVTMSL